MSLRHNSQCPVFGPLLMMLLFPALNILPYLCISRYNFSFEVQIQRSLHLEAMYVAATTWEFREDRDDLIYKYLCAFCSLQDECHQGQRLRLMLFSNAHIT